MLGELVLHAGDLAGARARFMKSLDVCRDAEDKRNKATALWWLGKVDLAAGAHDAARTKLSGALRAFQAFDMFAELLGCLEDHSELVTAIGRVSDAVRLGGAIESLRGRRALARAPRDDRRWKAFLAEVRDALSPAEFERAWTDGKTWEMQDAVRFAHAAFAAEAVAA